MKVINIIFFGLSVLFITVSATANDKYANFQGQGEWYSSASNPAVRIFIKGTHVYAESLNRKLNLPATQLKRVNGNLLNEYTTQYIQIHDFNHDGFDDIAVLKSVSYGAGTRCYSVFSYMPSYYAYKSKSAKTVCIE